MRFFNLMVFVLLLCISTVHAQNYAVQATVQLVPPYSVYLSDYATEGNDKLRVILLQKDLSRLAYQLRLVMSVELNGKVIMRTSPFFMPPPINLDAGVPTIISGAELAPYVDSRNIDFIGYSKEQYEKTKSLPEGAYRILFTAYDYRRQDQPVSNQGSGFYYLAKSEPPLVNYPACGTKVVMNTPQFVTFSWMPRNTSSPNSAQETEYEFTLFETRPVGRNPNDVVLSTQPVFRMRTDQTQLVYGPADPLLLEDMTYVWRVQAIDRGGRDAFRNNGYSEVCTFRYGPPDVQFDVGVVKNLQAIGETPTRGKVWWDKGPYEGYKVFYRKAGDQYNWFPAQVSNPEYKIFDLEANNEYEVRLQAIKSGALSPYSAIVKFRTPEQLPAQCGDPVEEITDPGPPLLMAQVGMRIMARDIGVNLVEVTPIAGEPGWYKGFGWVTVKFLGGARFNVQFERLYINANREATDGRIDFISKGAGALLVEKLKRDSVAKAKEITAQQQQNRDAWAGTDFYSAIIHYDDIDIETVVADNASFVSITDAQGNVTSNGEVMQALNSAPTKAIIVQDKNGDQWVVQKDKASGKTKVSKVEGGGLEPGGTTKTTIQANPIKDRIIVLVLEKFEEEIAAWLRINGKGGEDDPDVYLAAELPMAFPKHAAFLTHLKTEVIPYFKEHTEKLRVEVEHSDKGALDKTENLFKTKDDVEWTKIDVVDQETLQSITATSLMNLSAGEINPSEITDIFPDCGRKQGGKDKPFGSLFLISYPKDCSYIREGVVNYYISKGYGKYLCAQERFDLIKCLATGIVSGDEEKSIITLLNESSNAHAALLSLLKADNSGLLRNINDGFQFGNYVAVFKAIQQLYLNGTTQAVINGEVEKINTTFLSDKTREEKAQQNYFTWFEGGILKAMFADNFVFGRFDDVSIANDGTISFHYATDPRQTGEATTPINIKPFALMGIRVHGNTNDVLEAGNASIVYVPGIMLPLVISKKETAEFFDALNATAVVTGAGAIVTGATRIVIVSGGIDILLGGSALVVDSYKDDILKMQNGKPFLDAYVLVNKAFLIYFGSRTILQLTQALPKLTSAFSTFKSSDDFTKLKTINPTKAAQIEKEIDDVLKESDEVLFSGKASSLQKIQYGSEELSKMVQNFGKTTGKKTGNVAVIEYIDKSGVPKYQIGESTGIYNPHAEKAAWLQLNVLGVQPEQVTRIYTELEPCASRGRYCKNFITRTFPNTRTYYSFDYLNGTTESCKASVKTLGEQINILFEK